MIDKISYAKAGFWRAKEKILSKINPGEILYINHNYQLADGFIYHSLSYGDIAFEVNFCNTNINSKYFKYLLKNQMNLRIQNLKEHYQIKSNVDPVEKPKGSIQRIYEINEESLLTHLNNFVEDAVLFHQEQKASLDDFLNE